jgi:hypothetical protein
VIVADPGRSLPGPDIVEGAVAMALFDLPDLEQEKSAAPAMYLAAACHTPGWRSAPVEVCAGGGTKGAHTAARKSILGRALSLLAPGQPHLLDLIKELEVELVDDNHWLESCDDEALVMGSNLAVAGCELIQFGRAEPIGPGRFRVSRLLRGRRGTEWAMDAHDIGEAFALLAPGTLQRIDLPPSAQGIAIEVRSAKRRGARQSVSAPVECEALRPPSPVQVRAIQTPAGDLAISWVRRSRHGWAWLDDIDAPLGEARELYRVTIEGPDGRTEFETEASAILVDAGQLASVGSGSARVSIQQLGDQAASRAATVPINLGDFK